MRVGWILTFWILGAAAPVVGRTHAPTSRPGLYRMSQLDETKKRAAAEFKPVAWIGTFAELLQPYDKLMGRSSHAATAYALRALQRETVMIYSNAQMENHQEPAMVDHELHTPNPHYTAPVVVILTPSLNKVIAKAPFTSDPQERIWIYIEVLKKYGIRDSWQEKTVPKAN